MITIYYRCSILNSDRVCVCHHSLEEEQVQRLLKAGHTIKKVEY